MRQLKNFTIHFVQFKKCGKFAQNDEIDELNDKVGDTKWSSVENKTLGEKVNYWNSQYATLTCEHAKMKSLVSQKAFTARIHVFTTIFRSIFLQCAEKCVYFTYERSKERFH